MMNSRSMGGGTAARHPSTSSSNRLAKKREEVVFDWTDYISSNPNFNAASVIHFRHAMWENISEGMKLDVENKDVDGDDGAFWIASIIKIQGYFVLLRHEGFGDDGSGDFWMHLCSQKVHPVGWSAVNAKPMVPPRAIATKCTDWRSFLVESLTGAETLPAEFAAKLESGVKSVHKVGDTLEVVDKNQISQLKMATVIKVVGGRLHLKYWDTKVKVDGGFWCHEESQLIHPPGWAKAIGHWISCPESYNPDPLAATPTDAGFENVNLSVGMKVEVIDPLTLSKICSGTITKVLRRGYVMIMIDYYDDDGTGFDWFCCHIGSNSVLPCGFCRSNGVVLTPPNGWDKSAFTWDEYFEKTGHVAAPIIPNENVLRHGFKEGMKIEAADLMNPALICPATVARVVGSLLKIRFDGWGEEFEQWMDASCPDIYPIGWCELVKLRLEPPPPPPILDPRPRASKNQKKRKK